MDERDLSRGVGRLTESSPRQSLLLARVKLSESPVSRLITEHCMSSYTTYLPGEKYCEYIYADIYRKRKRLVRGIDTRERR